MSLTLGQNLLRYASLALLGWVTAWSFAWPWPIDSIQIELHQPIPALQLLALVMLIYVLLGKSTKSSKVLQIWWFTTHWLAAVTWWLVYAMTHYTALPYAMSAGAVVFLAAALSLYMATCLGGVMAWLTEPLQKKPVLLASSIAAAWSLAEWLRAHWFTGFPWGEIAYTHVNNLRGLAPLIGSSGVSALVVFTAAWWALRVKQGGHALSGWSAALITIWMMLPSEWLPTVPMQWTLATNTSAATLVQGNIQQDAKFGASVENNTRWYAKQIASATTPLVVLPETAFVQLPQQLPPSLLKALREQLANEQRAALVGMPIQTSEGAYLNAVLGIAADRPGDYVYGKHHLVPFGEFVPRGFKWLTDAMGIPLGGFSAGSLNQPLMLWDGQALGIQVCYEDVFGDELARRLWLSGGQLSAWVNVSNLAWFGDTPAVAHHLAIARWRAAETGRPIIRATNTGATAIIDAKGIVTNSLPYNQQGQLVGTFTGHTGITPYVRWAGQLGHTPVWFISIVILAIAWLRKRG